MSKPLDAWQSCVRLVRSEIHVAEMFEVAPASRLA